MFTTLHHTTTSAQAEHPEDGPTRPRVGSERLVRALEAHSAAEAESIAAYERLADIGCDPLAAELMRLIVDDEQRHHAVLSRMVESLRDGTSLVQGQDQANAAEVVPSPLHLFEAITTTRTLIREEREGSRHLRHLARGDAAAIQGGAYAVLLETFARDSEKHERILRFLLRRLEVRAS